MKPASEKILDILVSALYDPAEHQNSEGIYLCGKDIHAINTVIRRLRVYSFALGLVLGVALGVALG